MKKKPAYYGSLPNDTVDTDYPRRKHKKILQVPVKIGWGEKQELVVVTSTIAPPSPPIFRIKDVDKEVVITQMKLIPTVIFNSPKDDDDSVKYNGDSWWFWGKVIVNGYVDKNVNYKTITDFTETDVNGPLFHFTTRVHFSTFIEVKSKVPIVDTDQVELLSAVVEGEKEELLDPNPVPEGAPDWAVTYNRLLEKIIVRIEVKIKRIEEVPVMPDC